MSGLKQNQAKKQASIAPTAAASPPGAPVAAVQELVKGRGHEIIFLPKFHCELNPIEMVSFFTIQDTC